MIKRDAAVAPVIRGDLPQEPYYRGLNNQNRVPLKGIIKATYYKGSIVGFIR